MLSHSLNITPPAKHDLTEIWLYTQQHWGNRQAEEYVTKLLDTCRQIDAGTKAGKAENRAGTGVHYYRCEHHYIYYTLRNEPVFIAFMHERRDMLRLIKGRLG